MARLARVVVPGVAHHVTQRGNRRQPTFFQEDDYRAYLELLGEWCGRCTVQVWAYCLVPNHVHLIVVPESEDGLRRGLGEAAFLDRAERLLGRFVRSAKRGPKAKRQGKQVWFLNDGPLRDLWAGTRDCASVGQFDRCWSPLEHDGSLLQKRKGGTQ